MCENKLSESFTRELELLNLMVPKNEDAGEIATVLGNLCLTEEESNLVVYGPLSEAFYVVNCPFVWSEYVPEKKIKDMITELRIDLGDHDWKHFCFQLYLGFLHGRLGELKVAFKQMDFCEEHLNKHADDKFYVEIVDGLNHIIQAMRAHLHFLNGDAEVADEIISSIFPLKDLGSQSKAALIVLNAEVIQKCSPTSKEMCMKMLETAIKLDPDDSGSRRGAWYYILGKLHGQQRRMNHRVGMPSREELQLLERAVKINPLPVSLATLADSYREASASAKFSGNVQVSDALCENMLIEAKKLYKQAFEMDDHSYSTLRRCGNGLMKLPLPHKDLTLAKHCLEKALSVNPQSAVVYQSLGTMEEKHFRNLDGALKYFQLSHENGNPIACTFVLQVRMKMNKKYNPTDDIDNFLKGLEDRPDIKAELLNIKGEFLFFLRNNLLAAAKFWKEAFTLTKHENITNHVTRLLSGRRYEKPYMKFVAGRHVLNIYECLKYEIRKELEFPKYSKEDQLYLRELLKYCEESSSKYVLKQC